MTDQWQSRALQELSELEAKAIKLSQFMDTAEYDELCPKQQAMLLLQANGMALYATALQSRLDIDSGLTP